MFEFAVLDMIESRPNGIFGFCSEKTFISSGSAGRIYNSRNSEEDEKHFLDRYFLPSRSIFDEL